MSCTLSIAGRSPTSELGAAVAMALIKIANDGGSFGDVVTYINTSKATQIIGGILLSVVVAFSVGAFVQWISRVLLSYNFRALLQFLQNLILSLNA